MTPAESATAVNERLARCRVVPVVTIDEAASAVATTEALHRGGIDVVEITLRTDTGLAAIEAARAGCPETLVGAGTVRSHDEARSAIDAGAQFLVSPGFDDDVVQLGRDEDVFVLPGTATPTEVMRARRAGVSVVKLFPADLAGGPNAISALASVFPDVRFVPTGGVTTTNAADYLRLDAVAAIGGSWIASRSAVSAHDWDGIEARAAAARAIVEATA